MVRGQLRVFYGPQVGELGTDQCDAPFSRPSIPISLEELVSTLTEAAHARRAWLEDFKDDEVLVSPDLFEVLTAYQHYHRRPSA